MIELLEQKNKNKYDPTCQPGLISNYNNCITARPGIQSSTEELTTPKLIHTTMSSSPPAMWTKNIPLFFVSVIKNNFIHYLFSSLYQSTMFMLLILFLNVYWQAEMLSDYTFGNKTGNKYCRFFSINLTKWRKKNK